MKICANCFNDIEIQQYINNSNQKGKCECCENSNAELIELSELQDFLLEFFGIFQEDTLGKELSVLLENDWNLFNSKECAAKIISEIIKIKPDFQFLEKRKINYVDEIQECINNWNKIKLKLKEEQRFFAAKEITEDFAWDKYLDANVTLHSPITLYRARINPENRTFSNAEMACPPKEQTSAGRANPLGIPYLYLSKELETTLYEVRAIYLDKITVGEFLTTTDLSIVDFNSKISIFSTNESANESIIEIAKRKFLMAEIAKDLSKPIRRFDTELEYVPTQFICEYIRHIVGADGIQFASSLHKGGTNIVLFDQSVVVCKSVVQKEITAITIQCN